MYNIKFSPPARAAIPSTWSRKTVWVWVRKLRIDLNLDDKPRTPLCYSTLKLMLAVICWFCGKFGFSVKIMILGLCHAQILPHYFPHAVMIKQHSTSVVIWEMSKTVMSTFSWAIHVHGLHAYWIFLGLHHVGLLCLFSCPNSCHHLEVKKHHYSFKL